MGGRRSCEALPAYKNFEEALANTTGYENRDIAQVVSRKTENLCRITDFPVNEKPFQKAAHTIARVTFVPDVTNVDKVTNQATTQENEYH